MTHLEAMKSLLLTHHRIGQLILKGIHNNTYHGIGTLILKRNSFKGTLILKKKEQVEQPWVKQP